MDLQKLVRKNIQQLKAYSSARDEFKGEASVYLDANENPLNGPYNRYPDPLQWKLKERVSEIKGVDVGKIFFGNGSDEPIDIVYRVFCEPGIDNVVAIDPSYGMYKVCADINNVEYRTVLLNDDYSLNADLLLKRIDANTKLVFLCSPNNPSANILDKTEVLKIVTSFSGIVIIDEAYIDFSIENSWLPDLDKYPNLIVLQTFSKAWGLAAIRLGMAFALPDIIGYFNKVKYPYNINVLTQNFVLDELNKTLLKEEWVQTLISQREWLGRSLQQVSFVEKVYPSDANFILVKVTDANKIYNALVDKGIIVRNRSSISLCKDCLRITVGTESENNALVESLKSL